MSENNQMQMTVLANCTPEQAEAYTLHVEILTAAKQAADSLLDLGRKLKRMRDGGYFKALGYETFADYTEQEIGIRQRQAYNYITVVEKVPAQLVEENAAAGVTKLALLAKMAPQDQQEIAGDLANITVAELQKIIAERDGLAEQLSMAQMAGQDNDQDAEPEGTGPAEQPAPVGGADLDALKAEWMAKGREQAQADLEQLKREHEASVADMKHQHAEAMRDATRKAEADAAEKIKKAKADAEKRAAQEVKKAKEAAAEEARKKQEKADQKLIDEYREAAQSADERASAAEKQIRMNANGEGAKLSVLFDDIQEKMQNLLDTLQKMEEGGDTESAGKYRKALHGALSAMLEQLQDGNGGQE